jgi:hypothetical protein
LKFQDFIGRHKHSESSESLTFQFQGVHSRDSRRHKPYLNHL